MTISTSSNTVIVAGTGSQYAFNFNFVGDAAAYIYVSLLNSSGSLTPIPSSQYSILLNPANSNQLWGVGGTVTYPLSGSAIPVGTYLVVQRILPFTQIVSIQNQGNFYPQVTEQALDVLEMQIQQLSSRTTQFRGIWTTNTYYNFGDIAQDGGNGSNTGNYYICQQANTSGTWSTDLSNAYWNISVLAVVPTITLPLIISQGGTGATTASAARTNLGLGGLSTLNIGAGLRNDGSGNLAANGYNGVPVFTSGTYNCTTADINKLIVSGGGGPNVIVLPQGSTVPVGAKVTATCQNAATSVQPYSGDALYVYPIAASVTAETIPLQAFIEYSYWGANIWVSRLTTGYEPQGGITGLIPTAQTFSSSTVASMTISAGQATDTTGTFLVSTYGGGLGWNITNGNAINGYQGGTTLPNSTTIHFYVCNGTSGIGCFASSSLSPTIPSGYNSYYRRMFSIPTNSSGVLLAGTPVEVEGGALLYWLSTPLTDISTTTLGTSRTLYTLSVPQGIKTAPQYRANDASASNVIILTSGDEPDTAPNNTTTAPGFDAGFISAATISSPRSGILTTNTSGQIGARASTTSVSFYFFTSGWKDFRRA